MRLAASAGLSSLCTFEFLLPTDGSGEMLFIEANPRLQVEHPVTEAVTGIDLVACQLLIACGSSLSSVGIDPNRPPTCRGWAIEARINMETMLADGSVRSSGGTIAVFEPPTGAGVRVDTCGHAGFVPSPSFDSLLAKVIVHTSMGRLADAVGKARRALDGFAIEGVATNAGFLRSILSHPAIAAGDVTTRFIDDAMAELVDAASREIAATMGMPSATSRPDGEPPAVLDEGTGLAPGVAGPLSGSDRAVVLSPVQGTVVAIAAATGDVVGAGALVAVVEAMKMEHLSSTAEPGLVTAVLVRVGDLVVEGQPLAVLEPVEGDDGSHHVEAALDLEAPRPDLAEVLRRRWLTSDEARPDAVRSRHELGRRTARENLVDLCDPGSFVEYGGLAIAAQRGRRSVEDLIANTPADGLIAGIASVNGERFGTGRAACAVLGYDYTVHAGTQGHHSHRKTDRVLAVAEEHRLPVLMFTEGGGGRPGDVDMASPHGLHVATFSAYARLSGVVPRIAVNAGRCFAGNAALLGASDIVIATGSSTIGMGGPALIEGGGLGVYRPEEVGPMSVQVPNGVVDVAVAGDADAVAAARQVLSYFQGREPRWDEADQRRLRAAVPENRKRAYDMRAVIDTLADVGSVLELRRGFAPGMITALARIHGFAVGVVANNPAHDGGAVDSAGSDKVARFLQLCEAFRLPVLFLCDTPGMMVGPAAEETALVRHCSRLFVVGASLTVPTFTIILRKAYGLGALTMAGGHFAKPVFAVSWPTGEFGGMGFEGAVTLGHRKELEAIPDPDRRRERFDELVDAMYRNGTALSTASFFEIDDVIDPADSRTLVARSLRSLPEGEWWTSPPARFVDTW
jgi:acetyl-CoA carboxylase carboxyltransferase component/biotin carboxyl carrier protein